MTTNVCLRARLKIRRTWIDAKNDREAAIAAERAALRAAILAGKLAKPHPLRAVFKRSPLKIEVKEPSLDGSRRGKANVSN